MAATTRRSYAQTMNRLTAEHGALPVGALGGATLDAFTATTWGQCGPATWNRHVATLRSFTAFARRHGWLAARSGRGARAAHRTGRPHQSDHPLLAASGCFDATTSRSARSASGGCCTRPPLDAQEVLSADVADLDLENKRMRVRRKGGDSDWLHFQSGSARLLPRLIGDRNAGPIFLADRRPSPARAPASLDLCPVTGRGRLSYERSAYLFKQHSLKVSTTAWTLHQLRHSALTHLAEDGVNLPLLMAKSGHQNLRSLQKYARPGAEAVAAMTAAHDPARRRL